MSAPDPKDQFQPGVDILSTSISDTSKKIEAQTGTNNGAGQGEGSNVEWWQHVGFASRPSNPVLGKECAQAVVLRSGGQDISLASQDLRGLDLYGALAPGETCLYASGADGAGQARILLKADGSVSLFSKQGNTTGGTGMLIQLDAANNAIRLLNASGHGIIIDEDGVKVTAGDACLNLTAGGNASLIGTGQTQVDGSGVVIGSLAVPGVNSALTGVTGVAGKASLKVLIE